MTEKDPETLNDDRNPEHENCGVINELEESSPRGSFGGSIKDAPGCGTMVANALSQQSIHEVNVLPGEATGSKSDLLVSFDTLNVSLGSAAYPYLQSPALEALQKAINDRGTRMVVNSAYRALAQQFLLYNWWTNGVCDFQAVARPGASYHQAGLAIDIENTDGWRPYLERYGWQWFGSGDYPHFTYVGGGQVESVKIKGRSIDIRNTATLAFQRLWNRNNSGAQIAEDGDYSPTTESKLRVSPANGFKIAPWEKKPRLLRLSQPRMEGSDVERLQTALKKAGINVAVDGEFGPRTDRAVKDFQAKKTLTADGIVSPKTLAAMA
ncbi:peptidoglycan-binding protein [Leptolyngbya sp. ST-U4]|uniref:peptidoglycan-binding protein n=1 Tax=Leptolyngbya sp. ST-U4 TaxID=2933912 RepID=UPI00329976BF